jgi:hypothetical protein
MRKLALGGCLVLVVSIALTPWYALDDYVPDGWDATWWARAAAVLAVLAAVALRTRRDRIAAGLIGAALACVVFRAIVVPDFGFGFDGLAVPVERRWGLWLAVAAAALALIAGLTKVERRA